MKVEESKEVEEARRRWADIALEEEEEENMTTVDVGCHPCGEMMMLESEPEDDPTIATVASECDGWVHVQGVLDSGAVQSVAPPDMAPNIQIRPSEGSKRGQHDLAANGHRMPNLGEQNVRLHTVEGKQADVKFQITGVTRPLLSVGEICDRGNRILFGQGGGIIQNIETGNTTSSRRCGGTYTLDMCLPKGEEEAQGFPGQGRR